MYSTEILESNICDYSNAYILVRGNITTYRAALPIQEASKNCARITKCILKIDGATIDNAED